MRLLAIALAFVVLQDDLPRRGAMGVRFGPNEAGDRKGVRVVEVMPDMPALKAGVLKDDVLLLVDGRGADSVPGFIALLKPRRGGEEVVLTIRRGQETIEKKVTLVPFPKETAPDVDIIYGSVSVEGAKRRTIVTKPRAGGPFPAVLILQGFGVMSIEGSYTEIAYELTRRGFITMRVEKSGMGDSQGAPCQDGDFRSETEGFAAATEKLKKTPGVDPDRVFLFGHSMGGVHAPIIAARIPVRGVIVYGTVGRKWLDYELENDRRQAGLERLPPERIEDRVRLKERALKMLLVEKLTPTEILKRDAELEGVRGLGPDDRYLGFTHRYWHQVGDVDPAQAWAQLRTRTLALWGASDFVSSREDHERIAEIVNRSKAGSASAKAVDGIDHWFMRQESMESSARGTAPNAKRDFNPVILRELSDWMTEVGKEKKEEKKVEKEY